MIAVKSHVGSCPLGECRATGTCRGYPWRCHRSLAEVADLPAHEKPAEGGLRPRLPPSEIGT